MASDHCSLCAADRRVLPSRSGEVIIGWVDLGGGDTADGDHRFHAPVHRRDHVGALGPGAAAITDTVVAGTSANTTVVAGTGVTNTAITDTAITDTVITSAAITDSDITSAAITDSDVRGADIGGAAAFHTGNDHVRLDHHPVHVPTGNAGPDIRGDAPVSLQHRQDHR